MVLMEWMVFSIHLHRYPVMSDDQHQYYLLTPHEVELVTCYRMMSLPAQEVISGMCAAQSDPSRQECVIPVKLSLVKK